MAKVFFYLAKLPHDMIIPSNLRNSQVEEIYKLTIFHKDLDYICFFLFAQTLHAWFYCWWLFSTQQQECIIHLLFCHTSMDTGTKKTRQTARGWRKPFLSYSGILKRKTSRVNLTNTTLNSIGSFWEYLFLLGSKNSMDILEKLCQIIIFSISFKCSKIWL